MPELCYLLILFSLHPDAKELTERKLESKAAAYQSRITSDIQKLARDGLIALHESENTEKSLVYLNLAKKLQWQYPSSQNVVQNLSLNLSSLNGSTDEMNMMPSNESGKP